jgi:preprotein translocase subunit SecA
MSTEQFRRDAYGADVTYISNKQLVFDYLKDRQSGNRPPSTLRARLAPLINPHTPPRLQRGLCFAIVDEADSVLIDEAKTPLILSRPGRRNTSHAEHAVSLGVARRLEEGVHFTIREQRVHLTESGQERLEQLIASLPNRWKNSRYRDELIVQSLTALHLLTRDKDYLVRDDKIVLLDENTGRAMPDRSLAHGLHQMVQIKEGCTVSPPTETLARTSFQNFFRKYIRIGGMTGTAREVAGELVGVYGLGVKRVPTHHASARVDAGVRLFPTMQEKYAFLVAVVKQQTAAQRPVLIGTRSVIESEQVQRILESAGLSPLVLNAAQDAREAQIIARAGEPGQVVVATNMAGRGTDIPLHETTVTHGGLHVISTQLNDSPRLDRQLYGRCARQGDPGSHQAILSLEDDLFRALLPNVVAARLMPMATAESRLWQYLTRLLIYIAQLARGRQLRRAREAVRHADRQIDDLLSFAHHD